MEKIKKIVVASENMGKIKEYKRILQPFDIDVFGLSDLGINIEVEEDCDTFIENAHKKAKACFDKIKCAVISDDSGLCINALDGAPGLFSARYVADHDNDKNIAAILQNMQNEKNREAFFECAIVLLAENFEIRSVGKTYGSITKERIGKNGFGYDSIFLSKDLNLTFGEATKEQKDSCSHRAKALAPIIQFLKYQ